MKLRNKLLSLKIVEILRSSPEANLIILLSLALLLFGLFSPKSIAKGDQTQDNSAGTWIGTLGPAAAGTASSDIDSKSAQITINNNTTLGQYEAVLSANGSGYFVRSKVIAPPTGVGGWKKWKQLKLGFRRPSGTNTTFTADILCGDLAQSQCPTYGQPLSGYSNIALNSSDEYTFPASLTVNKIMVRVNFSSVDVNQPQSVLYSWQVSWEINSGVNLTVSKSSNVANPELQVGFDANPGVANNNTVVYTLDYSLDRNVSNLTIELPFPAGTYTPSIGTPKTYTATYIGSSGGIVSGSKVVWYFGNKVAGTVGQISATFKIQSGPPEGVVFKTKGRIYGSDYSVATLPDDSLNIVSKAFAFGNAISPEYIAPSREVTYTLTFGATYYWFQSDMFNPRYEFTYSTCLDNVDTNYPKVYGTGLSSWSVDRPNRKLTFTLTSPMTFPTPNLDYVITLKSNSSCGVSTVPGTLTFFSDQDATFNKTKTRNLLSPAQANPNWDATSTPRINIWKDGGPNPIGAGQRIDYNIRMDQRSNVPATEFWVIDPIPAQTTFIQAYIAPGIVYAKNGTPKNNWKIYWSSKATQPSRTDASWTEFTGSPLCSGGCKVAAGQEGTVKWVKWDVGVGNSFYWDRYSNFDPPLGQISLVTSTSASGTLNNNITSFAGNTCTSGCSYNYSVPINNQPYFSKGYDMSNTTSCASMPGGTAGAIVQSGSAYCSIAFIANHFDSNGDSHGDATTTTVTLQMPDYTYLDPSYNPSTLANLATPEVFARCVTDSGPSYMCPQTSGGSAVDGRSSFLKPSSVSCTSVTVTCRISWTLPIIYSYFKYPQTKPYQYNFYVQVDTKLGLANQTQICLGQCQIYTVVSNPANSATNQQPRVSAYEVTIASTINLNITNSANPQNISCVQTTELTQTFDPSGSTGSISSLYVMNALPEDTSVSPPAKLVYVSENHSGSPNMTVYYLKNYSRSGNPPSSDTSASGPGWTTTITAGQEDLVNWVMWKKTAVVAYNAAPESVKLTLHDKAGCSPNGTTFTDKAYISYDSSATSPSVAPALITIVNPGFSSSTGGDVGSSATPNGFSTGGVSLPPNCSSLQICTALYSIVGSGSISSSYFNSFKSWVLAGYTGLPNPFTNPSSAKMYPNYDKMFADYGRDIVSCNSETSCLGGTASALLYDVDAIGSELNISDTSTNYTGPPRILFVKKASEGTALSITATKFVVPSNSAIIFVVKGNVQIGYGVGQVDGAFLVDGQFATGRRVAPTTGVKEAGKFAAISIGRDGFARIAYLSEDNVRFIRCNDLVCDNKDYGYVATATGSDVTSINMALYEDADGNDYPKIVIGMKDASGKATTKFVSCIAVNCLDTDPIVSTYNDVRDPDILINNAYGWPSYIFGSGSGTARSVSFVNCSDKNCPSPPPPSPIDGGSVSGKNKGNEISYSIDIRAAIPRVVGTYVDRTAGSSDLWFTKFNWVGGGTTCSESVYWDCKKLASNVELYPASFTHSLPPTGNGTTKVVYVDSTTKVVKYLNCSDQPCSVVTTKDIDCTSGCLGQPYSSVIGYGLNLYAVYNAKNGSGKNEVKLGYCPNITSCQTVTPWTITTISNNPTNPSGSYVAPGDANIWTQAIDMGRTVEAGYPRMVFAETNNKLFYVHCKNISCSDMDYKQLDDGSPIALKDKKLTINGSVFAFGNNVTTPVAGKAIKLERDLFQTSTSEPGEVFNLEPKYFYLLKDIIKPPEYIKESPP